MATASQRPDLQALLAHAQAALRVKDWEIEIGYVPDLEMGGGPVWGTCASNGDMRKAWIAIRDPLTPPPGVTTEQAFAEVAKTVIHETAHLLFVPFANTTPAEIMAEENAVWAFSEVLEKVLIPQMTTAPLARLAWKDAPKAVHARRHVSDKRARIAGGASFSQVTMALGEALRNVKSGDPNHYGGAWPREVYDERVVYELDGKLYQQAYTFDGKTATLAGEITEVVQTYAPIASPAPVTRKVAPSVAREGKKKMSMSYETMGKLIKALGLDPTATEDTIKKALGMGEDGAPEEPATEPMAAKDAPATGAATKPEDPEAMAAKARLIAVTGKPSVGEAARMVEVWKKDSAELADLKARTVANQAALDASERKALVARLVAECGELPATAWKDPLAKDLEPGPAWAGVDLDTLRNRVATLSKAPKARDVKAPTGDPAELSKRELDMCAEMKIDPKDYAARKVATRKAS